MPKKKVKITAIPPEDAAIANVLMNRNRGMNWVDRAYDPNRQSMQVPGEKGRSTHLMEYSTNDRSAQVYPRVVEQNGQLQYMGDGAYDYAMKTGEFIDVPMNKAQMFSQYGYKKAAGIPTYQKGGKTKKAPIYVDNVNDPRYRAYQDSLNLHNAGYAAKLALLTGSMDLYGQQIPIMNKAQDNLTKLNKQFPTFIPDSTFEQFQEPIQPVELKKMKNGGKIKYPIPLLTNVNVEEKRPGYNPVTDIITIRPEDKENEQVINHENFHAWQNRVGRDRVPELYEGPYRKPSIMSTNDNAANYYNRKGLDVNILDNKFINKHPDMQFAPQQVRYDKYIDNLQYSVPWTMEGEAQQYEETGQLPQMRGGGSVPPFVTSNKNLYRQKKKKYDDSTSAYNSARVIQSAMENRRNIDTNEVNTFDIARRRLSSNSPDIVGFSWNPESRRFPDVYTTGDDKQYKPKQEVLFQEKLPILNNQQSSFYQPQQVQVPPYTPKIQGEWYSNKQGVPIDTENVDALYNEDGTRKYQNGGHIMKRKVTIVEIPKMANGGWADQVHGGLATPYPMSFNAKQQRISDPEFKMKKTIPKQKEEYRDGEEYEIDEYTAEKLRKLGYEFDIL